jgi:transposase
MNRKTGMSAGQIIGTMGGLQVVGLDIAKRVFQMHTGEIVNVQIKRAKVLEHFANRARRLVGMEACGGAHHWARELRALGHEVRLLHAKAVRPFVSGNKTDAADARAIWLAVQQPGTGGKVRLQGISKRGDSYLRTLLIHGARSVLHHAKEPGPWLEQIQARCPANVVIVAQAAKMARTIWAVTARQQEYQRGYRSVRPLAV